MNVESPFLYRGCHFICSARPDDAHNFAVHVLYLSGLSGVEQTTLPQDTAPYRSAQEAIRHAQQQAMRWVHDRMGDGQGQF